MAARSSGSFKGTAVKMPLCIDQEADKSGQHQAVQQNNTLFSAKSGLETPQTLVQASSRPLPDPNVVKSDPEHEYHAGILRTILSLQSRDLLSMVRIVHNKIRGEPVNDRTYLMEKAIQLASDLPLNSPTGVRMTNSLWSTLWSDLEHPPLLTCKQEDNYRTADGSHNNLQNPQLGAAGTHYARSVPALTLQNRNLPEPELIFDTLLARQRFQPHPTRISSVLLYLAIIITHDIFNTDPLDSTKNKTSSYLDLSPLYGCNQDEQDKMRTFRDGKLKPDCFADSRLLTQPAGVGVFVIMFNRWHNFVVERLAGINENGRFTKPESDNISGLKKYDNDLFQVGRLITCNLYCNIILHDYVRVILNLNRTNNPWILDPRAGLNVGASTHNRDFATGNQVSVEFNLIYRWHAGLSARDEASLETVFRQHLDGKDPATMKFQELLRMIKAARQNLDEDPQKWPIAGGLSRDAHGKLPDEALSSILTASIEDVSGAFGPNHIPNFMRAIEVLGIMRARQWKVATLNEFRAHFGLTKHETFEDINPDTRIADTLKQLYGHPDLVELYVGICVEDAKVPMVPGSGLCAPFTLSRAILSDAVALVRGDRFYTIDCTPHNFTNWGFRESGSDISIDHGCVLYKLFLTAFPRNYKFNSVYAHFPMVIPSENEIIHRQLGISDRYDYSKPETEPQPIKITSHAAALEIVENTRLFKVVWGERVTKLVSHDIEEFDTHLMPSVVGGVPDSTLRQDIDRALHYPHWRKSVQDYYTTTTQELLRRYSSRLSSKHRIDLVRDVINIGHTQFAAEVFQIPIRTKAHPKAFHSEHKLYSVLALVFEYIFFDGSVSNSFARQESAEKHTHQLGTIIEGVLTATFKPPSLLWNFFHKEEQSTISSYGTQMLKSLRDKGHSNKEITWTHILPTASSLVTNQSRLLSEVMAFYLRPENTHHWKQIQHLSTANTDNADTLLKRYILEASRLQTSINIYRQPTTSTSIQDFTTNTTTTTKHLHIPAKSRILIPLSLVHLDPISFPNPREIDLTRPLESYLTFANTRHQDHSFISKEISLAALVSMLKVFASLKNLGRSGDGGAGDGDVVDMGQEGGVAYLTDQGGLSALPVRMRVEWDVDDDDDGKDENDGEDDENWVVV